MKANITLPGAECPISNSRSMEMLRRQSSCRAN